LEPGESVLQGELEMKSSLPMQTSSLKNELEGEYLEKIRKDFPILQQSVHGKPLVYLDNSATTQKPKTVIEALKSFYEVYNANVHRGIHTLSEKATERFEHTRQQVHTFLNSTNEKEIVFTRGATEAINLVAQTYGRQVLQPGDEILLSAMEHHSNIVPWRLLAEEKKALIRVIPMDLQGELDLNAYEKLL
jgi:cysteine desulfurase/selenocysteine lyase